MAISEKSRSALYQGLTSIAGEEAASEMLSNFPSRDVDEPVTKEFLRAELNAATNRLLLWLMATILTTAALAVTVTVNLTR
jgi:hypothetical protein